ncbi:hypothetical protein Trco_004489 [Trichoderma cornu-damae]|uniref:Uncharacterized protein n=1 Tax=Trichoderma cornu-damae TaxID=654480 RepID=A0A9P8QN38_9HYPO|nr:hypothetical protein Trco_004489 [Trichoderma cornu-damae]
MFRHSAIVAKLRALVDDMATSSSPSPPASSGLKEDDERVTTPPTTQRPKESPSPSQPARRAAWMRRPEKGSLWAILRENAGKSLFVRPIGWTDTHTGLLGVRFWELPATNTPRPFHLPGSIPSLGHLRPTLTITRLSVALTEILSPASASPRSSSTAVKAVLMTLWPAVFANPLLFPDLNIYFGDKAYHDVVRAQAMWNFPPSPSPQSSQSSIATISTRPAESYGSSSADSTAHCTANLPMLCYMGKSQLAYIRRSIFRIAVGPNNNVNSPVQRLQQLRAKQLFPADENRDAHFVGIFVAMAQRHFYAPSAVTYGRESYWSSPRRNSASRRPDFQDVKMRILTHDVKTSEFLVYTGYVTAKFLDRFYDPYSAPRDDNGAVAGMKIEFTRVPIWPILGLRERLGKALGEEVVGPFDSNGMETWQEDGSGSESIPAEPEARSANIKRKRTNSPKTPDEGLEEESDEDQSSEGDKKRRLGEEGNRFGVVF